MTGDEEARDGEKDVDADEAARQSIWPEVEEYDENDRDGTQSLNLETEVSWTGCATHE